MEHKQLVKWQNSFSLPLRAGTKLFVVKRDAVAMSKKNFSQRWGAGGREGGGGGGGKGGGAKRRGTYPYVQKCIATSPPVRLAGIHQILETMSRKILYR